jgi:hypothetical protein
VKSYVLKFDLQERIWFSSSPLRVHGYCKRCFCSGFIVIPAPKKENVDINAEVVDWQKIHAETHVLQLRIRVTLQCILPPSPSPPYLSSSGLLPFFSIFRVAYLFDQFKGLIDSVDLNLIPELEVLHETLLAKIE